MATEDEDKTKSPDKSKKQTVRERAEASQARQPRRIRNTAGKARAPLRRASNFGGREFHLIPLPDNRFGRILGKRVRLVPKFIREAWREIRQVTWPTRRETVRLTAAVFIFAVIFAVIVGFLDFGLDKLFKKLITENE